MSTSLGSFIRERRQELGLTQEQLADRIGASVRQAEVSRLENDRIILPRRQRLELLAAALDVSLGELLTRSGWMKEGDALPQDDLEQEPDPVSWNGPVPDEIEGLTLPELVAMLERISDAQDQLIVATIALEAARKSVSSEMQSELGEAPQAAGAEVQPPIGMIDDWETHAEFSA
jgi:transcriptional regulator with XRE-family HTH domain